MQKLKGLAWFTQPLQWELRLLLRHKARWAQPILFACLLVFFFPLGLGGDIEQLPLIWPTLIWTAACLAALWSAATAFQFDLENAAITQIVLSPFPLWYWLLMRGLAYWLVLGLPVSLITPALAYLMGLSGAGTITLMLSLLIGLPGVCLLALIASSLTLCLQQSGLLLVLMMLPLYIPFLVLGIGSVSLSLNHLPAAGILAWLGALSAAIITLGPFAAAQGIRYSLDD